jgi:hypothetical protein
MESLEPRASTDTTMQGTAPLLCNERRCCRCINRLSTFVSLDEARVVVVWDIAIGRIGHLANLAYQALMMAKDL